MEISVTALETVSPTLLQSVYICGSQPPPLLYTPTEGREFLIHSLGRNNTEGTRSAFLLLENEEELLCW